jgi:hypothetical protein
LFVPSAAVSVCGTIQPGVLHSIFGAEERDSGLFARLLLAFPPNKPALWTEADIPEKIETAYFNLVRGLLSLAPGVDDDGNRRPRLIGLDGDAKARFIEWHDHHARELASKTGDEAASLAKLKGACARLALVLHCVRVAAGDSSLPSAAEIDIATVDSAIELAEWFKREALRVLRLFSESDEDRDRRRLLDLIDRKGGRVTPRDVRHHGFGGDTEVHLRQRGFRTSCRTTSYGAGVACWHYAPP